MNPQSKPVAGEKTPVVLQADNTAQLTLEHLSWRSY
ncbi:hypothetical protein NIES4071_02310 [Calothrix sp. NIES-4071]|nr:hypothetical protein NIES4071_02310 [Calothrix sp. NIES-4071]BAZ54577.1 hypothetical protein NIES4105_02300 [Calothrix sp. NIES-4105]